MSGETIAVFGTAVTLEASGASIANGAIGKADDQTYDITAASGTGGTSYPDADPVVVCAFSVAPTEGGKIGLYAGVQDIDGTSDAEDPEASRPGIFIGTFTVNNVTTTQHIPMDGVTAFDLPKIAYYWLKNIDTGQTISSGWKLIFVPRTTKPAP